MMACATRKQKHVWLIGFPSDELPGNRLPSWAEVLRRYFKLHHDDKLEVRTASTQVVREVGCIWEKARIPTAEERNVITKLEKKLEQYRSIQRGKSRRSAPQIKKEEEFQENLADVFDIAHVDALQLIKVPEDREFLIAQRQPGRHGFMAGIDKVLTEKELSKQRSLRDKKELAACEETVELMTSSDSSATVSDSDSGAIQYTPKRSCRAKTLLLQILQQPWTVPRSVTDQQFMYSQQQHPLWDTAPQIWLSIGHQSGDPGEFKGRKLPRTLEGPMRAAQAS